MARNVFFSFDYDDVMAVNIVRNSNVVTSFDGTTAFRDYSLYEKVKKDDAAIQKAIDDGLRGTSVTVVLVGRDTWKSYWARYEIIKSLDRGNGLLVIDIEGIGPGVTPTRGANPLDYIAVYPWNERSGFDVKEWRDDAWRPHPLLQSCALNYPSSVLPANPVKVSQIFSQRDHWRAAQMSFRVMIEGAAVASGRPRGAKWI